MPLPANVVMIPGQDISSNTYLILAERPALIDIGMHADFDYLYEAIKKYIPPEKIESIILTHGHYDHWGSALDFLEFSKPKVLVHSADKACMETSRYSMAKEFTGEDKRIRVDFVFGDGDVLDLGDMELKVIHTPGHTKGCCCFLLLDEKEEDGQEQQEKGRKQKILFSGDTLFADSIGRTDLPNSSPADMRKSLTKLQAFDFDVLLPGHGPVSFKAQKSLAYGIDLFRYL